MTGEEPRHGREFLHSRYITTDGANEPARCVVTSVTDTQVFYRTYIAPGERGPGTTWTPREAFAGSVKEWLT